MDTNLKAIIEKILTNLTPDLLAKGYEYDIRNPTKNFCYVASEALYHLKAKELGYFPVRARDTLGKVHWWLENKEYDILDITWQQYQLENLFPPYRDGKRGGFLTKNPSKRCKILMERVGGK